jgi:hypothetical protein
MNLSAFGKLVAALRLEHERTEKGQLRAWSRRTLAEASGGRLTERGIGKIEKGLRKHPDSDTVLALGDL